VSTLYWQPTALDSLIQTIFGAVLLGYLLLTRPRHRAAWLYIGIILGLFYYFSLTDLYRSWQNWW
jgi:hypothetical protein